MNTTYIYTYTEKKYSGTNSVTIVRTPKPCFKKTNTAIKWFDDSKLIKK